MKIKSILFILIIIPLITTARNFRNKQFALFNYNVNISKTFRDRVQSIESYIYSNFTFNIIAEDKLEAVIYYDIYNRVQEKLEEEIGIDVLPVNSFLDHVKYNEYDYPTASIKKAINYGDSKYYFKLQVKIKANLSKNTITILEESNEMDSIQYEVIDDKIENKIQPEVSIEMTIFNKEGIIPVKKIEGTGFAMMPSEIEESFFYGMLPGETRQAKNPENLSSIIDLAISDLISKLQK